MKHVKFLAAPLLAMALLGGSVTTPASALEITQRHVKMIPYSTTGQSIYTCYYKYNFFERIVLGKVSGPRSGDACRR